MARAETLVDHLEQAADREDVGDDERDTGALRRGSGARGQAEVLAAGIGGAVEDRGIRGRRDGPRSEEKRENDGRGAERVGPHAP